MQFNNNLMQILKNCYDIRSSDISNKDAFLLGKSFGTHILEQNKRKVIVGYDRRKHSKDLHDNFIQGLYSAGMHVISLGMATTPLVQIAEIKLKADASVMVTASHNPADFHGFKFFLNQHAFSDNNLASLVLRIMQNRLKIATGSIKYINFYKEYAKLIQQKITTPKNLKVAWDCLNGCGSQIMPHITTSLNGTHYILNHEVDPTFQNSAPDPTYEPRLNLIKQKIKEKNLDFGIAIDGDADRCVIIDKNGKVVPGDTLLSIFAYLLPQLDKKIIWDSKSSNSLIRWAKEFSECHISQTGHSNIFALFKKIDAHIAGECSGHYIFSDFFGVNDGIYAALKLISILQENNLTLDQALNKIPKVWVADLTSLPCCEEQKDKTMKQIQKLLIRKGTTINYHDGIKACYSTGWWLIRPSRTEDVLRISAEGWTQEGLELVQDELNCILSDVDFN